MFQLLIPSVICLLTLLCIQKLIGALGSEVYFIFISFTFHICHIVCKYHDLLNTSFNWLFQYNYKATFGFQKLSKIMSPNSNSRKINIIWEIDWSFFKFNEYLYALYINSATLSFYQKYTGLKF